MKLNGKKKVSIDKLIGVVCDLCKKKMEVREEEWYTGVSLVITAGFGSRHDGLDDEEWDLCDDCADKVVKFIDRKKNKA